MTVSLPFLLKKIPMKIFVYDKTFEGLLTALFEAYERRIFPDCMLAEGEPLPLFYDQEIRIVTDNAKADRVWKGLEKKMSKTGLAFLTAVWLSELSECELLLLRYMRKTFDTPQSIELNFGDPDVLEVTQIGKKVHRERHRIVQFLRFQKTADDIFFAAVEPLYNVLSLTTPHFCDRFRDQKWIIYDLRRKYGYYYNLSAVTEIHFEEEAHRLIAGRLNGELLAEDEKQYEKLWKTYFRSITIQERINPKLHRQNLPPRFWKYLTEKH